jgi:hypothetical protein
MVSKSALALEGGNVSVDGRLGDAQLDSGIHERGVRALLEKRKQALSPFGNVAGGPLPATRHVIVDSGV